MTLIARLWRQHRIAFLGFAAGAAVTLVFAARLALSVVYWSDPAHRNQSPQGWMTPGYVARSWGIPREAMIDWMGNPDTSGRPPTLAQIARERGVPLADFLAQVETFAAAAGKTAP